MTIAMSLIGFGFCKAYRYYVKNQRDSLLQAPFDLSGGMWIYKITIHIEIIKINSFLFLDKDSLDNSHEEPSDGASSKPETRDTQKKFTKAQARHRYKKGKAN